MSSDRESLYKKILRAKERNYLFDKHTQSRNGDLDWVGKIRTT